MFRLIKWMILSSILAGTFAIGQVRADESLKKAIETLVDKVVETLKGKQILEKTTVRVSGFSNPFDSERSAGSRIRADIIALLGQRGVMVGDNADAALTGEYVVSIATDPSGNSAPTARITYSLNLVDGSTLLDSGIFVDPKTKTKIRNGEFITKSEDLHILTGTNTEPPTGSPTEYTTSINKPFAPDNKSKATDEVTIDGAKIRAKSDGRFAVEILSARLNSDGSAPTQSAFMPCKPILKSGVPYVELTHKDVIAVRVYNDKPYEGADTACFLTIDGLSSYHFSELKDKLSGHRIFSSTDTLFGWHINNQTSKSFLVNEYATGEKSAKMINDTNQSKSSINVLFFAAWEKPESKPADEDNLKQLSQYEIIAGPPRDDPTRIVQRSIGYLRASITVRYDRDYEK